VDPVAALGTPAAAGLGIRKGPAVLSLQSSATSDWLVLRHLTRAGWHEDAHAAVTHAEGETAILPGGWSIAPGGRAFYLTSSRVSSTGGRSVSLAEFHPGRR
jgi:hypothetical protein